MEERNPFAEGFWHEMYVDLGIATRVPRDPEISDVQIHVLKRYGFFPIYIPQITEAQYPKRFVKPNWGKRLSASGVDRRPLGSYWIAIESIPKPDWNDRAGYPNDNLMRALKKSSRFHTSWKELKREGGLLENIAKKIGFSRRSVRLPTVEEWNFVANLMNSLREKHSFPLPDLGSTKSWEWCENAHGTDGHLYTGDTKRGGLEDVNGSWLGGSGPDIGFRSLVVL